MLFHLRLEIMKFYKHWPKEVIFVSERTQLSPVVGVPSDLKSVLINETLDFLIKKMFETYLTHLKMC